MLRFTALILLAALTAVAQPPAPKFDVASIRMSPERSNQNQNSPLPEVSPGSLTMRSTRLPDAIRWAYGVQAFQVTGPDWMKDQVYDISAKSEKPATEAEMRVMLQGLLAERFKLVFHREKKETSALVLTVAKGGVKAKESTGGAQGFRTQGMRIVADNVQIGEMSEFLTRVLRMPVVDQTGLTAKYNYVLDINSYITPEIRANMPRDGSPPIEAQGIISSALQEQLGIRMDSGKVPLEMLVIDKAEREPLEN